MMMMRMIPTSPTVPTPHENEGNESAPLNRPIRNVIYTEYFMNLPRMTTRGGAVRIQSHGGADILINSRIGRLDWRL
ncbi:hypothetical protein ACHAWT_010220 [Skeletonema menzelii]